MTLCLQTASHSSPWECPTPSRARSLAQGNHSLGNRDSKPSQNKEEKSERRGARRKKRGMSDTQQGTVTSWGWPGSVLAQHAAGRFALPTSASASSPARAAGEVQCSSHGRVSLQAGDGLSVPRAIDSASEVGNGSS